MFLFLFLFQETPKIIFQNKGVNRQSGSRIPGRGTSRAPERRGGDPGTTQNGLRGPSVLTVLGGPGQQCSQVSEASSQQVPHPCN